MGVAPGAHLDPVKEMARATLGSARLVAPVAEDGGREETTASKDDAAEVAHLQAYWRGQSPVVCLGPSARLALL